METCSNCGHECEDVSTYKHAVWQYKGPGKPADYCDLCACTFFSAYHGYGRESAAHMAQSIPRAINALVDALGVREAFIKALRDPVEES